jgi:hypothetical protein
VTVSHSYTVRKGYIQLDGYAGRSEYAVMVIGETPKRYRIQATAATKLAGRSRWLQAGETTLVPKRAVTFTSMFDHSRGIRIDVSDLLPRATGGVEK